MYTIVMNRNKVLETTIKKAIHQREKLVDKIQFLFPQTYGDLDISQCTAVLKYVDQVGEAHAEILEQSDELYKERVRFTLPVDTNLTKYAGDIKIRITLMKVDLGEPAEHVLHTSQTTIHVDTVDEYFYFSPDASLEFIDQLVGKIDSKIQLVQDTAEFYQESKADGIIRADDKDGAKIQLTSDGVPIGAPVPIDPEEITAIDLEDDGTTGGGSGCNCECNQETDVVEF